MPPQATDPPQAGAPDSRARHRPVVLGPAWAVALAATLVPGASSAQTLTGRVLDQVNETAIGGAVVALVGRDGAQRARALSDSAGRFVLAPPFAGEFFIMTTRFGYADTRSPLLALSVEGRQSIELMLVPEPVGLEGLEVSVEELAAEELSAFGLSPRELGNRWIDRRRIDAIPVKRDMGTILERTSSPGTRIVRPEHLTPGSDDLGLCVTLQRARTSSGLGTCALIILDGVPIGNVQALGIDPETIESIAVLEPIEATSYYGTQGGRGAVLVWTRRGR